MGRFVNDAERVRKFLPAAREKEVQAFGKIRRRYAPSGDKNSAAAGATGRLDVPAGATAC